MVLFTIIQVIISFIIGWFIGRAIWKMYYHKRYRKRYFYVSYYTTKKVDGSINVIYGSMTFITSDGLYLNRKKTLDILAETADTEDDIVILNIIEFKEEDYYTFDSKSDI